MLPLYEKTLEKYVSIQLQQYLESNNILINEQSGFRKNHSCETAIHKFVYDVRKAVDEGKYVIAVFLDFKRAFETIDRQILLNKLHAYGIHARIHDTEYEWFKLYLTDRTQRVKIGNSISSEAKVELGVPQGSVLGVLLFILYINDIVKSIKYSKISLFADDTLIYITGTNIKEMQELILEDLRKLYEWLNMNKMKINVDKTKFICFNIKNTDLVELSMEGKSLERKREFKYLGVIIDDKLKFEENANYVMKKISKKTGYLRRINKTLNRNNAILLYNSLILPHYDFCSTLLFSTMKETKSKLQRLQNKGMRIILRKDRYTSIDSMLHDLQWMSVDQRIVFNAMIFIYKLKHEIYPQYLSSLLKYVSDNQPYDLRNAENFKIDRWKKTQNQNTIFYKGLQLYNKLPYNMQNEKNINTFKNDLQDYCREQTFF